VTDQEKELLRHSHCQDNRFCVSQEMACFSLFKALHTHRNDSTPLPSFPLSSSDWLENKEMIHGGGELWCATGREGFRDGWFMDNSWQADKQQEGEGKQMPIPALDQFICTFYKQSIDSLDSNR